MINALLSSHQSGNAIEEDDKPQIQDMVEDKGKGLVILLHRPPGVGKTVRDFQVLSLNLLLIQQKAHRRNHRRSKREATFHSKRG